MGLLLCGFKSRPSHSAPRLAEVTHRIPKGDELAAFIAALPDDAFITASGWVEGAEIMVARGSLEEARAFPGRVALLSLVGAKPGPFMATIGRSDGDGVVGGELVKARSAGVSVTVARNAAPAAEASGPHGRGVSDAGRQAAGVPKSGAASGAPAPRAAGSPASDWAKIAAIPHEEEETEEAPKYGDRVHHFVFGLCDVMVVRGDRLKIRDLKGPGRLREIHLNAVKVLPPTVEDGKRVFKLVKRS